MSNNRICPSNIVDSWKKFTNQNCKEVEVGQERFHHPLIDANIRVWRPFTENKANMIADYQFTRILITRGFSMITVRHTAR